MPTRSLASMRRLLALIPDRKSKHAAQSFDTGRPEFLIEVNDDFGIGAGAEYVTSGKKVVTQLLEVIDLPIKDDPDRAILVGKGLMPGGQIDDGETAKTQAHRTGQIVAVIVGPTMGDRVGHTFQQAAGDGICPIEI